MKQRKLLIMLGSLALVGLSGLFMVSCKSKPMTGMIIITQSAEKNRTADYVTGGSWRYLSRARLIALDPDKPGESPNMLSEGFYSACSPEISYDGKYLLFAGQHKEGDFWQIWEMDLENTKLRQVTSSKDNCIDPVYLPGNRFAFSKILAFDSLKAGHSLYTGNLDGSNIQRITFNPNAYFAPTVLHDGRILTISRQLYPELGKTIWMVLRPDGTKAQLFYLGAGSNNLCSRAQETPEGRILFIESDSSTSKQGDIISITYNRPLHTRMNLTSEDHGDFQAVLPQSSEKWLVSYRKADTERYALYQFDPESRTVGQVIYTHPDFDVMDVVVVEEHTRPKKLPSEVDMATKTGQIMCQDINILDPLWQGSPEVQKKAFKIEVLGLSSSMGIIDVAEDGSFYLKAMADAPFRLQILDNNGKVIHGPCDWIWLRPNERRGCIGCHEDPEIVPENRVPLAVKKYPEAIPVHTTDLVEKAIELE